jgi:hypothetical protein
VPLLLASSRPNRAAISASGAKRKADDSSILSLERPLGAQTKLCTRAGRQGGDLGHRRTRGTLQGSNLASRELRALSRPPHTGSGTIVPLNRPAV